MKYKTNKNFLPMSKKDMEERGWNELDVILVTGDAYVDHPSYGAAVISRSLEDAGFSVGIIAQPDSKSLDDFKCLGRPKLFFGVTAGNVDSMIANYTANKKIRTDDDYSPRDLPYRRPDRASIVYINKIREAFPGIPVVLGGIEASMRRLAHYDYWSDTVRRSILLDSKADILVCGMGETQTLEIAKRLKGGDSIKDIDDVHGTVIVKNSIENIKNHVAIPSFEEISKDKNKFNASFKTIYSEFDPVKGKTLIQPHDKRFVIQLAPARPLTTKEMDRVYDLPYMRDWHPVYDRQGGVPGFETVRFSIISHRGCPGACSFCSLYLHQGRIVQSRSAESILKEARELAARKDFRGTITDIGGPTANLYAATCENWEGKGACRDRHCLIPKKCGGLKLGYAKTLELWKKVLEIPGVKNLFIGSGVRYDLLLEKESDEYLKRLCAYHISGQLKVAPEHSEPRVLELMRKPHFENYEKFVKRFEETNRRVGKKQYLVNYFISAHPGATLGDALSLALALKGKNIHPEQIQDFLPLPMTISSCMYHTGKDPISGRAVYAARGERERKLQRAIVQYKNPKNKRYVIEALRSLGRMDLMDLLYKKG